MALIVTQEGATALWKQILSVDTIGTPNVHLFGQVHEPDAEDTEADYEAIELDVAGYTELALDDPAVNWTFENIDGGAKASYVQLQWAFTAACTVYGYWVADQSDTYCLFAEAFAMPYPFGSAGGTFPLILPPTLTSAS